MKDRNTEIYEQARRAVQQPCPSCKKMALEFRLRCDPTSSTGLTVLRCTNCKIVHAITAVDIARKAS